jgi:hypothetical protein
MIFTDGAVLVFNAGVDLHGRVINLGEPVSTFRNGVGRLGIA